jgi:hypothetical protein
MAGGQKTLFRGLVEDAEISDENGLRVLELTIMPYSRLLDARPDTRVFQDTGITFDGLVEAVLAPFGGAQAIVRAGSGEPIGEMFVQYRETAWAFLSRMASMRRDVVVPHDSYHEGGIRLYFGFPERRPSGAPPLEPISFKRKDGKDGHVRYSVTGREILELGEPTEFQGRKLYVAAAKSRMKGGELVHEYTLAGREGTSVPQRRNPALIGASLAGTVSAVSGSQVKLALDEAHSNDAAVTKWHLFSTVYSSPTGTGWYAMPEPGDRLRLYFPTEIDGDGYAISAVHLGQGAALAEGGGSPGAAMAQEGRRADPDYKVISNAYGKTVVLSPDAIYVIGEGGSVMIEDGVGVTIASDYDIAISGGGNVSIASLEGEIIAVGKERVALEQADATVGLSDGKVAFHGAEVRTI